MKNMLIVLSTIIALGLLYVGVTQPAQRSSVEMALIPVMIVWVLAAQRMTK